MCWHGSQVGGGVARRRLATRSTPLRKGTRSGATPDLKRGLTPPAATRSAGQQRFAAAARPSSGRQAGAGAGVAEERWAAPHCVCRQTAAGQRAWCLHSLSRLHYCGNRPP